MSLGDRSLLGIRSPLLDSTSTPRERERERESRGPAAVSLPLLRSKSLINIFLYVPPEVPQGPGKSYSAEVIDLSSLQANKDQNKKRGGGLQGRSEEGKINLGSFDDAQMGKAIITLASILQIASRESNLGVSFSFFFLQQIRKRHGR